MSLSTNTPSGTDGHAMPAISVHWNSGICPIALTQKLTLLQIDQYGRATGACSLVIVDFKNALRERRGDEAVDIINRYADELHNLDKLEQLERLYRWAIEELGFQFGRHSSSALMMTFQLGKLLQGLPRPDGLPRLDEAEQLYGWSLNGIDQRNPYKLYFLNELGVVHSRQVRLVHIHLRQFHIFKAEEAFRTALYDLTAIWGGDNLWTRTVAVNLGDVYESQGRLKDAAILLIWGLLGLSKLYTSSHELILDKARKLIRMYQKYMGHNMLREAQHVGDMALETFTDMFGPDHELTLIVVGDLANIQAKQKKLRETKKPVKKAPPGLQRENAWVEEKSR